MNMMKNKRRHQDKFKLTYAIEKMQIEWWKIHVQCTMYIERYMIELQIKACDSLIQINIMPMA